MYNLYYWYHSPTLMCTFSKYDDCKKALDILTAKYPTCKIWMESVNTINSFNEWNDKFNGEISDYERLG